MRKMKIFPALLLSVGLLLGACGAPEPPVLISTLEKESVRYDLASLLQQAGVPDARRYLFFRETEESMDSAEPEPQGFVPVDQRALAGAEPMENTESLGLMMLAGDTVLRISQEEDQITAETRELERQLTMPIPLEACEDQKALPELVTRAWSERGITILENPGIRILHLVLPHGESGQTTLIPVPAGILLPTPDGDLWFLEKPAAAMPYRVVKLGSRRQLIAYLTAEYELTTETESFPAPFLMENGAVLTD